MPSVKSNETCTICYCVSCPLDSEECKQIMEAVGRITDETRKKSHTQTLHGIYVQQNEEYRRAAEELKEKLIGENPELEELD